MCFGMQETEKKEGTSSKTFAPNPAVANAATGNLNYVNDMRNRGFSAYGGEQVANFSPLQNMTFDMAGAIAGNGTGRDATHMISRFANAPGSTVTADPIYSRMSPYMNQYVMEALGPQLHQMSLNDAAQRKSLDAAATSSNAFGDARTGIERANLEQALGINRAGVIGQAYDSAFKTAIGAGGQDVANSMNAQIATGNFNEQALGRLLGGSVGLQNLQNQQLGIAKGVNEFGQQMTAQDQAKLNAVYNQWLMAQEYPFKVAGLGNQTALAGSQAMPANQYGTETQTTSKPDNSGWSLAGTLLGMFI